jgi:hypothetical protein
MNLLLFVLEIFVVAAGIFLVPARPPNCVLAALE